MELREAVFAFDGKHVGDLKAALTEGFEAREIDLLMDWCGHEETNVVVAASWLLRGYLEKQGDVSDEQLLAFCNVAKALTHWEAQLHFLQSVQFFVEVEAARDKALSVAEGLLDNPKTLVRVWAFDAAVRVLMADGKTDAAEALVSEARSEKAASYRARARRLVKEFPGLG